MAVIKRVIQCIPIMIKPGDAISGLGIKVPVFFSLL